VIAQALPVFDVKFTFTFTFITEHGFKAISALFVCVILKCLLKLFSSEHDSKSGKEVNEIRHAAEDANTSEAANSGAEDSMAENADMDLDVMDREYSADVDMDPAIDDVSLNDVYGRVGLGGVF